MNTLAASPSSTNSGILKIGNIPIRNLWLLMLYASDFYRQLDSAKIAVEDNPDEIADLVAEILCYQVERSLMRNLSLGYQSKLAVIGKIRGRINMLYTERHELLNKGKVCCRFEVLSVDTPRNRYVREALELLSSIVTKKQLSRYCRTLAISLGNIGVSKVKAYGYRSKNECFGHYDTDDQKMVAAAELAFSLALPTELAGQYHLPMPDKKMELLRKLFEKGVAGFYSVALNKTHWRVSAGKQFNWQISDKTAAIEQILPVMKTDIIVANNLSGERLVIDTKFNAITTKGWYREETLRSGYIYQMYTYLRSQEFLNDPKSFSMQGMLLHPSIDKEFDEAVTIQGHQIRFCTVNLGCETTKIRERLLNLVVARPLLKN